MSDLISRKALLKETEKLKRKCLGNCSLAQGIVISFENIITMQPTVEAEPQWIPCSERLPKCNGCYLVWRPHFFGGEIGMPAICYFDGQDTWHDSYGVDFTRILNAKDVIAWMPLPSAFVGE